LSIHTPVRQTFKEVLRVLSKVLELYNHRTEEKMNSKVEMKYRNLHT
jgi:hypothetical protein